jgi:predicted glycoside hydrolase/deacetylase ChbG (UPF0249 family)
MRIITNADDLGGSPEANQAAFDLMKEGLVTSSTILANGKASGEACRQSAGFPRVSFGAHLNVTQFRPLSSARGLGRLLDGTGTFNGRVREGGSLWSLRAGIYEEWCAQIAFLLSHGVAVSHLDSHHHVHTIPALLGVLKAAQKRYAIRRVRISRNVYESDDAPPHGLLIKKHLFNAVLRHWYRTRTTGAFTSLEGFCENRERMARRFESVEIMLHPGAQRSSQEAGLLRSLAESDEAFSHSLISYHDL